MEMANQSPLFDQRAIHYVFSYIMHHPSKLYSDDKILLTVDDFPGKLDSIIFGALYNLAFTGINRITPVNLENYLTGFQAQYDTYIALDGPRIVSLFIDLAAEDDEKYFDLYYSRVKKFTTLRELKAKGFSVDEFYNPSYLNKEDEEERFNRLTVADILSKIREKVQLVENKHFARQDSVGQYASKGIRNLLSELRAMPEVGIPIQGEILNYTTRGCRKGKMYMYSAPSGGGKALPNSTLIPMFDGTWKTVGEVKVGDKLIDRYGKPTTVLQIYPQGYKRVYEVSFKDGRTALCNDEHLWSYNTATQRGNKLYTKTLREIINEGAKLNYKTTDGAWKYLVPVNEAVQYAQKDLKIDPYIMGLMIGDGSFRQHDSNKALQFSSNDTELIESIERIMNWGSLKGSEHNYTYYFYNIDTKQNVYVEHFLKDYPELLNTYATNKSIPDDYLYSSVEDRWALFQGLMDTDGSIDNKGCCSFSTTSDKLAQQMRQLCLSLGLKVSVRLDERMDKYTNGYCYDITIMSRPEDKCNFFRLSRKVAIVEAYLNNGKRKEANTHNAIVNIEDLGYDEEMTCFYVDNNEHLFLTEDYIVTHNTRTMVGNACSIAFPYIENGKLVRREQLRPVLFVATEMSADEIQTLILAWISGVDEEKILLGSYSEDEEKLLNIAIKIMEQYEKNFIIEAIPNPSIKTLKGLITNYILNDDIEYIFYDYIFTSVGLMNEFHAVGLREDVVLMMLSNTLKEIAAEYNVFVMTGTQLNGTWEGKMTRNANMLRGSKAIADKIDVGVIGVRCCQEEIEQIQEYAQSMGVGIPNLVLDVYKNRRGKMCDVKIFRSFHYGTCRTKDLFATTQNYRPLDGVIKFQYETVQEELSVYGNK